MDPEHLNLYGPRQFHQSGLSITVYVVVLLNQLPHMGMIGSVQVLGVYTSQEAAEQRARIEELRGDVQVYPSSYFEERDRVAYRRDQQPTYFS